MNLPIVPTAATKAAISRDDALTDYISACTARGSASVRTRRAYRHSIGLYLDWCHHRAVRPDQADRRDIEAWRGELCAAGAAPATVMLRLAAVRTLYKALQRAGVRGDSPAEHVKPPRLAETPIERVVRKFIPIETMTAVLAACGPDYRGRRDRALLLLMYVLGLRVSEVQGLDWGAWDGDTLTFQAKGRQERTLALPEGVKAALAELQGPGAGPGPIFRSGAGRLSTRAIQKLVTTRLAAAGRPGLSPHALRHSCAAAAACNGSSPYAIQDQLGHASLRTTSTYTRAAARFMDAPSLAVAKALGI